MAKPVLNESTTNACL